MQKVEIAAPLASKDALLAFLQQEEVLHLITPEQSPAPASTSSVGYRLAQLQLALDFLVRIRSTSTTKKPAKSLKHLFASKPQATLEELMSTLATMDLEKQISRIQTVNERLSELRSSLSDIHNTLALYSPWRSLALTKDTLAYSALSATDHILLSITSRQEEAFLRDLSHISTAVWQEIHRKTYKKMSVAFIEVIVHRQDTPALHAVIAAHNGVIFTPDLTHHTSIAALITSLESDLSRVKKELAAVEVTAQKMLEMEEELQFAYDALLHEREREDISTLATSFAHTVVLRGWIPSMWLRAFTARLEAAIQDVAIEAYPAEDSDKPPVRFTNSSFIAPFESITNIYGKPGYRELDPSGALSVFFLLAFGLALTDAGYGIVMMIGMFLVDRFMVIKKDLRKMVRLLFMAGFATFILGALTGGWFGIALEELPQSSLRDILLSIKLLDPIKEPIKLLGVTFALGILQLLFAWVVKAYSAWVQGDRLNALLDNVPWITMIAFLLLWVGSLQGILPATYAETFKLALYINAGVLILTQGRTYKNPFLKIGGGVLSLFGLMSFMSDMLSYSRLLALGLATGIIGFVVNLLAGMAIAQIPIVGFVLALGILLVGHTFNLGINTLGAFIHSGRLQFVEFFPKFLEGGGMPYKPFGRVSKYVDNPKDFTV